MTKDEKKKLLAAHLEDARGKQGIPSQEKAAELVGCHYNTYKNWAKAKRFPNPRWHQKIIKTHGLPEDYFLSLDGGAPELDGFARGMEDELRAMRSQLELILRVVSPPGIDVDDLERAMRVLDALHAQESRPTD